MLFFREVNRPLISHCPPPKTDPQPFGARGSCTNICPILHRCNCLITQTKEQILLDSWQRRHDPDPPSSAACWKSPVEELSTLRCCCDFSALQFAALRIVMGKAGCYAVRKDSTSSSWRQNFQWGGTGHPVWMTRERDQIKTAVTAVTNNLPL